ncbi:phosphoribosyltransferase [Duganella hordei]|uniref:phosphoribosyltransferase n=1 Tax=Duganella hordei TaxID=2865934 RepID=UPI0030EA5265
MRRLFNNRLHAGKLLADRLHSYAGGGDVIVLGLPRGGVPTAYAVAEALAVPLDVVQVRKLGLPGYPEYAIGAVAGEGPCLLNLEELRLLGMPAAALTDEVDREREEIARREIRYRGGRPPPRLRDRIVILVDDGLATGATMRMAILVARQARPAKIIVAVPVAPREVCRALGGEVDELVCLHTPHPYYSVGEWYRDFEQVGDEEVASLLARAWRRIPPDPNLQPAAAHHDPD